jgi:exopolysaccharide biosynthesis polyprenyl glycosylphosphotransferase
MAENGGLDRRLPIEVASPKPEAVGAEPLRTSQGAGEVEGDDALDFLVEHTAEATTALLPVAAVVAAAPGAGVVPVAPPVQPKPRWWRTKRTGAKGPDGQREPKNRLLRWDEQYRRSAMALDLLSATAATFAGLTVAFTETSRIERFAVLVLVPTAWVAALALTHGYEKRYLGTTTEEYRAVTRAAVALFCVVALTSYTVQFDLARSRLVATILPFVFVAGLLSRHALRRRLYIRRTNGKDVERTVVIGDARTVSRMIREIRRAPAHGMHIVAACVSGLESGGDGSTSVDGVPVFGYPDQALSTVDLFDAEVVAVSGQVEIDEKALRRLAWALEERSVDLVVAPGIFEVAGPRLSIRPAAGMALLHVERPVMSGARRLVKRVVDRVLSVLMGLAATPLLVLIAVAVRLDSPGPVLFRQKRVGARGEVFEMLKFRTMCVDAEARLAEIRATADAGNDVLFKMRQDPRLTRLGPLLRRFSLDELPQLINVLRGEMSLVGPRPPLPSEVAGYESDAVRRLRVQPGLTGLWQVSGRSDLSWDDSLRLDLWYVDNWSLMLDLQILARTLRAVFKGQGAY